MSDQELAVPTIKMRGRNGYFSLQEIFVSPGPDPIMIGFYSRRSGNLAPVSMSGSVEELRQLLVSLLDEVDQVELARTKKKKRKRS